MDSDPASAARGFRKSSPSPPASKRRPTRLIGIFEPADIHVVGCQRRDAGSLEDGRRPLYAHGRGDAWR
jgi:hypothetical protein